MTDCAVRRAEIGNHLTTFYNRRAVADFDNTIAVFGAKPSALMAVSARVSDPLASFRAYLLIARTGPGHTVDQPNKGSSLKRSPH
jgi:hypothetical protein